MISNRGRILLVRSTQILAILGSRILTRYLRQYFLVKGIVREFLDSHNLWDVIANVYKEDSYRHIVCLHCELFRPSKPFLYMENWHLLTDQKQPVIPNKVHVFYWLSSLECSSNLISGSILQCLDLLLQKLWLLTSRELRFLLLGKLQGLYCSYCRPFVVKPRALLVVKDLPLTVLQQGLPCPCRWLSTLSYLLSSVCTCGMGEVIFNCHGKPTVIGRECFAGSIT